LRRAVFGVPGLVGVVAVVPVDPRPSVSGLPHRPDLGEAADRLDGRPALAGPGDPRANDEVVGGVDLLTDGGHPWPVAGQAVEFRPQVGELMAQPAEGLPGEWAGTSAVW
jgi:hypothetical protein